MEVYLNRIDGLDDAIISMFVSKRNLTRDLEMQIRSTIATNTNSIPGDLPIGALWDVTEEMEKWLNTLAKWCPTHITLGRFLDFSFSVYGLHRAGQDDIDSHARRMENRILRSSTRLANFEGGEMSDYYKGKVIPTDVALAALEIQTPDEIEHEGKTYVRAANGYILKGLEKKRDVKRGLYMLSIPSNFVFKANLTEFAHIYKERNNDGTAHPEVKKCIEMLVDQLEKATMIVHKDGVSRPWINRDLLRAIKN